MTEFSDSSRVPTSIVAIGVGNRMLTYMHYVESHPDIARLVAVVEPDPIRRNAMGDQFGIPEQYRYKDYHGRNAPKLAANPRHMVETSHLIYCIVS